MTVLYLTVSVIIILSRSIFYLVFFIFFVIGVFYHIIPNARFKYLTVPYKDILIYNNGCPYLTRTTCTGCSMYIIVLFNLMKGWN
jgi:cytochrome c oxidase assembly factor CtaG